MLNVRNVMATSGDIRDFMNVRYGVAGRQIFSYIRLYIMGRGWGPLAKSSTSGKPLVEAASGLLEWLWDVVKLDVQACWNFGRDGGTYRFQ